MTGWEHCQPSFTCFHKSFMYPAMKEMDPVHSGTGIFYQAIPAVGADGKNIMKLIPVQMVNGQFFTSQISQPKPDAKPQKAVTTNTASAPVQIVKKGALNPPATKQFVRKQVSSTSAASNQLGLDLANSLNKHPLQQQNVNLMAIVPSMTTPAANSGKSGRPPNQPPVTVKSPALSRGQCFQIPPNAQVQTLPASEQPLVIQKQTFTSANSSLSLGFPSAVYMSPITSVNLGLTPQNDSALEKLKALCNIANTTSSESPSIGSKLIPKVSQTSSSPIKWVIEEEDSSAAPTLDHIGSSVTSEVLRVVAEREIAGKHCDIITKPGPALDPVDSSVTSEILRVAAERQNSGKHCDVFPKPVFGASQGKSGQGQEKTLTIHNGKHQIIIKQKAPMVTPVAKSGMSGRPPCQLPVTVKSPALSRGQCLQIPPSTQVPTVPASELPLGIQKQIFSSSANSSPSPVLPSAAHVSPITVVNLCLDPHKDSALDKLKMLSNVTNKPTCETTKGSKPHLKLIPKVSQRPNSPIKWAIEEEDNSSAPSNDPIGSSVASEILRVVAERENAGKHCDIITKPGPALDPIDPSVTSEILRVAAERENAGKDCDIITKPVSGLSRGKSGQGQENNLIMCKGKMFFVAKNSKQSFESVAPQKRQGFRYIILDESDEVIDLCDDDTHEDSSQQAASVHMSAVTHPDEDNVIFVSYIPPKSESGSTQDLRLKTQMGLVKEAEQMGKSSSDNVTEQKSLDGPTGTVTKQAPGQNMSVNTVTNVTHACGAAVMNMHEGSNIGSQQSTSTKQPESMDGDTESPANPSTSDSSSGTCSGVEMDAHKMKSSMNPTTSWTSSPALESCEMADNLLRQTFGITADVKICLQRIDGASVPAEALKSESIRSAEDHQEPSGLKEKDIFSQDLSQEIDSCSRLINTPSPHTHKLCSHFKQNTKLLSVLRNKHHLGNTPLKATSHDVEREPVIGYVEPIDEDFLSTDENDIHNSQDVAARSQHCVDLDTNTKRMGRKRKRTMCPCCIPGTQDPAMKPSAQSEEPEQLAWTTERTSKKGGRTKVVRKDVKTSGRINCLTAKNKHVCGTSEDPASDSLSTSSMDSDELKLHEQIIRLKELLQEKEAALELMRNSTS